MSLFNSIQDAIFDTVTTVFGDVATWSPYGGGDQQSADILYKDSSEKYGISDNDYDVTEYKMEYKAGVFTGLMESVDEGNLETVSIGAQDFFVRKVIAKFDGKTFVATLNIK